jgi:tetratricopeptide (TPR) repeat protein
MLAAFIAAVLTAPPPALLAARDAQDRAALEHIVAEYAAAAQKAPKDAEAQYRYALASSYLSEVALEVRDKGLAQRSAENGIQAAERAISLQPNVSEYHRVLGTLCGQVIPANVLTGLSYGKRAQEAIAKALQLDPRSAQAYLARGVGNYYLPAAFGGGMERALADFHKASELDPKLADAWLWTGLALRKSGKNAEARKAFNQALQLDPKRVWAKQQLDKTPAQ